MNVSVLFEPLRFLERYHEDGWVGISALATSRLCISPVTRIADKSFVSGFILDRSVIFM